MTIVSLIYNTVYWIFHIHHIIGAYKRMLNRGDQIKTKEDVRLLMRNFIWKEDRFIDWQPWVITLFNKSLTDDCDGAGILGKWALDQICISSRIVRLWKKGKRSGHSVCVSNDNTILISNDEYVKLDGKNFPKSLYDHFGNHFDIMT